MSTAGTGGTSSILGQAPGRPLVRRVGTRSLVMRRRSLLVSTGLVLALLVALLASMMLGDVVVSVPRALLTLAGGGTEGEAYLVLDLRLPRAVVAVLVGVALGVSGGLFQTLTRNPLGSPDIVGLNTGAATGALVVLLVLDLSSLTAVSMGAVLGGVMTAAAVFGLTSGRGAGGYRLILVGIGIGALMLAVNSLLIVRSEIYDAQGAAVWMIGNLIGRDWGQALPLALALLVLLPLAGMLGARLRMLELSDDTATALGIDPDRVRWQSALVGVALSGVAIAIAGPIAFVALTAPQVARRLTRAPGVNLVATAITGALIVLLADLLGRWAFLPRLVPVGVTTGVVGGLYLLWLLGREWRKGRA